MGRDRIGAAVIASGAIAIGVIWLTYLFVRFGPLEIGQGLWADYLGWGLDLEVYLGAAGRITSEGTPYAAELIAAPFESGPPDLYYYSPVLATMLLPAADAPWAASSTVWFALHAMALAAACALMPVRLLTRALAFGIVAFSLPVIKDAVYGNVSMLLLLPMVMAWRWIDRPLGSIAIAFAASLRPSLGLLLVWQLLRRRWQAAAWTIGAGLVLVVATLPAVGIDGYLDYVAVLQNLNVPGSDIPTGGFENHDLGGIAMSYGASPAIVGFLRLVSIALGVSAMWLSLRRDPEVSYMVTLMASFIVVPLLWDHYLVTLVIPAAFLAERWRPVALLLPLLAWLPTLAFFWVLLAMLMPLFLSDRTPTVPLAATTRKRLGLSSWPGSV